jgi:hypothetical protein
LDNYTPLRHLTPSDLERQAVLFPVKNAWLYVESRPLGGRTKGSQGDGFYTAENPPFGAVFTYYLQEGLKTLRQIRRAEERELVENDKPVAYPEWDALRAEERELTPAILLTVRDANGAVVRRISGPTAAGMHRVAWDLRLPATDPIRLSESDERAPWNDVPSGPLVVPGEYSVTLEKRLRGEQTELTGPVTFAVSALQLRDFAIDRPTDALTFQLQAVELSRAVRAAVKVADEAQSRLDHLRRAILATPAAGADYFDRIDAVEDQLRDLRIILEGDRTVAERNEPTSPSIRGRVGRVLYGLRRTTGAPTATQRENLAVASQRFGPLLDELTDLVTVALTGLENDLERLGAPHTPGRIPTWPR